MMIIARRIIFEKIFPSLRILLLNFIERSLPSITKTSALFFPDCILKKLLHTMISLIVFNKNLFMRNKFIASCFLFCFMQFASYAQEQNFDTVEIKTTKITESIYMLEGAGGNIGVLTGK